MTRRNPWRWRRWPYRSRANGLVRLKVRRQHSNRDSKDTGRKRRAWRFILRLVDQHEAAIDRERAEGEHRLWNLIVGARLIPTAARLRRVNERRRGRGDVPLDVPTLPPGPFARRAP